MTTAEQAEVVPEPTEAADREDVTPAASSASTAADRYLLVLVAVQIAMIGGVVWLARSVSLSAELQASHRRAHIATIEQLSTQTAQVVQEHQSLKDEIAELRGFMASRSTEDVLFLKIMIAKPRINHELAREIAKYVQLYAMRYEQDADLVLAMIQVESRFDPNIVSHMGATGLMQVMPQWKRVLGIDKPLTDIETSIKYGLQILGFYKEMYKDLEMALTAYNRGPGPVDAALMKGRDPKNKYAPRVLAKYRYFRALNSKPG